MNYTMKSVNFEWLCVLDKMVWIGTVVWIETNSWKLLFERLHGQVFIL